MQKKIKIKDISRRINLSDTTVSLVLNNRGDQYGIKRETQEKVLMLAKKLGYFDQKAEKSPIERAPGVIGVVLQSLTDCSHLALSSHLRDVFYYIGFGFYVIIMDSDRDRYVRLMSSYMDFYS
ncbi:MAG: LacI family DNA-binding transcriptional regulator [Bacteroidales bacterium]|nr:LacI family DNA-binding transcriptional regulator [Bacteroidales bacterium]